MLDEVIWGHIDILVVAVRSLSRSEQVKTLLAGPSPMKGEDYHLPYFQQSVHNSTLHEVNDYL